MVCVHVYIWVPRCLPPVWPKGPQPPVPSHCRTATVWRSLSPFWGEEYTIHLPLDFHHLAFYVLDEDTVGCVYWGPLLEHLGEDEMAQSKVSTQLTLGACSRYLMTRTLICHLSTGTMTSLARSR